MTLIHSFRGVSGTPEGGGKRVRFLFPSSRWERRESKPRGGIQISLEEEEKKKEESSQLAPKVKKKRGPSVTRGGEKRERNLIYGEREKTRKIGRTAGRWKNELIAGRRKEKMNLKK